MGHPPDDDLDAVLAQAWHLLAEGAARRAMAWNRPALATVGADGAPALRTVVLRAVAPRERGLHVHTDLRSAKVAELEAEPRAALHVYDPGAAIQLRLDGRIAILASGSAVDDAWAECNPGQKRVYATTPAPGTRIGSPAAGWPPVSVDPDAGRARFAVLLFSVARLEWLHLGDDGHRRAAFSWSQDGWAASWLVP